MATWGYEKYYFLFLSAESISHLFTSLTRERHFQHEKRKFISPSSHVISSISVSVYLFTTKKYTATQYIMLQK